MSSQEPVYTNDQLEHYLQRINYADSAHPRLPRLHEAIRNAPLEALAELQRRHLCSIPWGNSSLHYSQHRCISVHPQAVYEKLVLRRLDGYCMETTNLFYGTLRSLGYQVYPTAGRVSRQLMNGAKDVLFTALSHMVLIATIDGEKYMVDVGFGNACATRPIPLQENIIMPYIAPAEMRLIRDSLDEFTDKSQRVWIYQVRYTPRDYWISNVCFSEAEFLSQDFALTSFFTSQHPSSWFTQTFVCNLMIMHENEQEVKGQYVISGKEVKRRINGQTEVIETLNSEDDRVRALAKWFGLHLRKDEVEGIRGLSSELK